MNPKKLTHRLLVAVFLLPRNGGLILPKDVEALNAEEDCLGFSCDHDDIIVDDYSVSDAKQVSERVCMVTYEVVVTFDHEVTRHEAMNEVDEACSFCLNGTAHGFHMHRSVVLPA